MPGCCCNAIRPGNDAYRAADIRAAADELGFRSGQAPTAALLESTAHTFPILVFVPASTAADDGETADQGLTNPSDTRDLRS